MQVPTAIKTAANTGSTVHGAARSAPAPAPARSKPAVSKQISQPAIKAESTHTASQRNAGKRMSPSAKRLLKVAVDAVWKADSFGVFKLPVTKRVAPDYYQIVKQPMDLKTVRQNLDKGAYDDELAFKHVRSHSAQYEHLIFDVILCCIQWRVHQRFVFHVQDMDLIFYNCELYNGLTSQVGKHGTVVKRAWLKAWEQSGLDRSREAG